MNLPDAATLTKEAIRQLDLQTAEALTAALLEDIKGIDAQLGDLNRQNADGMRMSGDAWNEWRRSAKWAKTKKEEQYRAIKRRLHSLRSTPLVTAFTESSAAQMQRSSSKLVLAVYAAGLALVRDDSEENWARLEAVLRAAGEDIPVADQGELEVIPAQ